MIIWKYIHLVFSGVFIFFKDMQHYKSDNNPHSEDKKFKAKKCHDKKT